jgi:hypothetical protein
MRVEKYYCDIKDCKKECDADKINLQVIFLTEQTEGRNTEPYLSHQELNVCKDCICKILKGNYVFATGAQGYNEYFFKEIK